MTTQGYKPIPSLKWIGLILASLSSIFWMGITIPSGIAERIAGSPFTWEGVGVVLLVLLNSAGAAFSWINLRRGGQLLITGGMALSVFAIISAGHNRHLAVLASGIPFLVAGLLIHLSLRLAKAER